MNKSFRHIVYLSLGSNLGNRMKNLNDAIKKITETGEILKISSVHITKPWGFNATTDFLNCCLKLATNLSPIQLLQQLQQIEKELGKTTNSTISGYQSRTIDIDIILYDQYIYHTRDLKIPHPLYRERLFVMNPLVEILD